MHPAPAVPPVLSPGTLFVALLQGFPMLLRTVWPFLLLAGAVFFLREILPAILERRRLAAAGIGDIDQMDGLTFEKYLSVLFARRGYAVERTPYVGDWGADLVIRKDGVKTVVQAKRYKKRVGVRAVQEVVASKGKYSCTEALVVTNSTYTAAARELAHANRVELWDRERLVKELAWAKTGEEPLRAGSASESPAAAPPVAQNAAPIGSALTCAVCGAPLSPKVASYCQANSERFSGKLYCFDHQRAIARRG